MDELADRYPPLNAGALCLDFANTFEPETPSGRSRDHLGRDYRGLIRWAQHAALVDPDAASSLARRAAASPSEAAQAVADAHGLRDAVTAAFTTVAVGEAVPTPVLARLRDRYAEAMAAGRLVPRDDHLHWSWDTGGALAAPLWPVAVSAVDLLTGTRLRRVKQCDGERCWVLFIDTTKNASRRWCLMRYCGNVSKSRRQAARRRALRQAGTASGDVGDP